MNNKILIVDDDVNILASFARNFRLKYTVVTAQSGEEGLQSLEADGPFAVIIADYYMPGMNGVQFLTLAKKIALDSELIMFSGQADLKVSIEAINEGDIFRFLSKPCPTDRLEKILIAAVEKYRLVTSEREILEQTLKGSIKLLANILSIMSPKVFRQATNLRKTARKIAERLMINNLWEIELAALFSQIGCVTIPGEIMNKVYGGELLTKAETEIYFSHANAGGKLLRNIPRLESIANAITYQFKQFNGDGYPRDEIKGQDIPLMARIIKVVIDYETLLSQVQSPAQVLAVMRNRADWYDKTILAALDAEISSIQTGFVVKALRTEEMTIGMVLADDIKDSAGAILIPKGYEITDVLQMRLIIYSRLGRVVEPIRVLEEILSVKHKKKRSS